ncbi:MAG TPA: VOC family protein [Candidatus Limnocylindria bacterium]|nr:VOC family protein [Candidatus Limnocylindria bacterium]
MEPTPAFQHIAITVPDLEQAERYYTRLFDMDVVTREAATPEGDAQLPPNKDWDDARRAGIEPYMVALRRGSFTLALFNEASPAIADLDAERRRPLFIGLVMREAEMAALRARLNDGEEWDEGSGGFRDRYGIVWQLAPEPGFAGAGERAGKWLDV